MEDDLSDGFSSDSPEHCVHPFPECVLRCDPESLFRWREYGRGDGGPCDLPDHRYHPDRDRGGNVAGYADRAEPGGRDLQAIADTLHKSVGFTKNCFDLTNITITLVLSFVFAGHLVGVGVGTVLAMIGVGRTIAVFNHFTYEKMKDLAGVEEP